MKFRLTDYQLEKTSSYLLTLSHIIFGSLVVKFFEPGKENFDIKNLWPVAASALLVSFFVVIIGIRMIKRLK